MTHRAILLTVRLLWGARSSPRKPTCQHIFGSGETGVSALKPIATPLYTSMNLWIYAPGKTGRVKKMTRTHTTRYITLLSVVLALALTAALAACGSDEPSGVTGPDRTASTPTETPASPARTPTTHRVRGHAPTATDSTPTATCATCDCAARGLRLRGNGPGSPGCLLQRNGR